MAIEILELGEVLETVVELAGTANILLGLVNEIRSLLTGPTGPSNQQIYNLCLEIYGRLALPTAPIPSGIAVIKTGVGSTNANLGLKEIASTGVSDYSNGDVLALLGNLIYTLRSNALGPQFPLFAQEAFDYNADWFQYPFTVTGPYSADPASILPTDASVTDWLNRVSGVPGGWGGWTLGTDGYPVIGPTAPVSVAAITCRISDADFQLLKSGPSKPVPPVWPGTAGVTLGSSVPLDDGLTVAGPLDGLLITITGVPVPIGYYPFGSFKSFVRVGSVIFVDDHGEAENAIPLGPQSQVVVPNTMVHADHAILRLKSGTSGTVQPWTAN